MKGNTCAEMKMREMKRVKERNENEMKYQWMKNEKKYNRKNESENDSGSNKL